MLKRFAFKTAVLVMAGTIIVLGLCSGCAREIAQENFCTYSSDLGFTLTFPAEWDGRYVIEYSVGQATVLSLAPPN